MTAVIVGAYSFMLAVAIGLLVLLAGVVLAVRLVWAVWHRPRVIDVLDFGARGDGVTDDTEAIQAAIDFASVSVGSIVITPRPINRASGGDTARSDAYKGQL